MTYMLHFLTELYEVLTNHIRPFYQPVLLGPSTENLKVEKYAPKVSNFKYQNKVSDR